MKKAVLMITAALALLLGCNESLSLLTKITITSEVKEVYVGGTLQLTASVEPADVPEAVVWSSSDEKTATVDQKGVVTGIKEGTVTVKLASKADENMCDTVEITVVKNPNPVTVASVVIMDGETSLSEELTVKVEAGENGAYTQEKAFQAVVNFSDGSEGRYDETVSWSLVESQPEGAFELSAEGVLSFNLAEKTGTDAALGSAEIEAVSNYDGTTKTAVRINMVDASAPDSLEIVDESGYGFEGGTLALFEGGSGVTAQVFVNPTSKPQKAEWSVEPAGAVKILLPDSQEETTVSGSAAKVLLKKGEVGEEVVDAVVTVTQDGVSARLSVSFPEAAITLGGYEDNRWIEGETLTLTAADASFDITSIGGTPVEGNVWTVPAPTDSADSQAVTLDCECLSSYGESFTVSVAGKIYSDEHVRRDSRFFKKVKEIVNFNQSSDAEFANSDGIVTFVEGGAAEIDVSALQLEGNRDSNGVNLTLKNYKGSEISTDGWLMELTVVYSDISDIKGVIELPGENGAPWFWLLRNSFGGNVGGGTGFRVGPYSGSEEAAYTISENEPFTLGYLFDGSDRLSDDKNVKFFFNGENKFVSLEEDKNSTPAAPSLGDSVKLNFWQEDESEDPATMTIQKAVFYKPVE